MRTEEHVLSAHRGSNGIRSYHSILLPQRRAYNAHHHTECELSVFLSGRGTYTVGEKAYPFEAGSVFLFGSNEEHCITEITEEINLLNVQFEPYILWERPDTMELLSLFNARNTSFENRFRDETGEILNCLRSLENELSLRLPCYTMTARYYLFMALTHIIRNYACIDYAKLVKATDGIAQSLRLAIDYIQENLESKLTLASVARVACFSPTYFSYIFKKFNGISLWEYINIKRVERAVEMLKNERMTKLEIAERCGFSSASNFYKTFSAVTGKTPSEYAEKRE